MNSTVIYFILFDLYKVLKNLVKILIGYIGERYNTMF